MSHKFLSEARKNNADEFYTSMPDIEKEISGYKSHFKNKTVFLNCNDSEESNFLKYFLKNFKNLKLKKVISTFKKSNKSYKLTYDGFNIKKQVLKNVHDFKSDESIKLLNESDIVVTNPPFSLIRYYIDQLIDYNKNFIILGNINLVTHKKLFKLIKDNKVWLGYTKYGARKFKVLKKYPLYDKTKIIDSDGNKYIRVRNTCWFTNLTHKRRNEFLKLDCKYKNNYLKFDNYDAINIDSVSEIPKNYKKLMGVPVTFLDKYNPKQFKIVDGIGRYSFLNGVSSSVRGKYLTNINGKPKYSRIIIKNISI